MILTYKTSVTLIIHIQNRNKCWCNALYLLHKQINSHESRFSLHVFGLLTNGTQRIRLVVSSGREPLTSRSQNPQLSATPHMYDMYYLTQKNFNITEFTLFFVAISFCLIKKIMKPLVIILMSAINTVTKCYITIFIRYQSLQRE